MSCYSREILSRYQDGSLAPAEVRRVDAHLDECESCREVLRSLGRAGLMLRLTVGSHRAGECLAEEELGAYLAGVMRAEDRGRVEEHLTKCSRCLHEVAVMSDDAMSEPAEGAPEPDAKAMARFTAIAPTRTEVRASRRSWRWSWHYAAAAAALALATFAGSHITGPAPAATEGAPETAVATITPAAMPRPLRYITEVSFGGSDTLVAPASSAEMTRFARETGTLLREIERVNETPRREAFELLQEDILNSGLVESVARLRELTREERDRRFLNDCEFVLMQVVKSDGRDLDSPVGDLTRVVAEMRRLKLAETARLLEMEGSRSQWLAGL